MSKGGVGEAEMNVLTSGKLRVRFSPLQPWGYYNVVSTDYTSYVVVYSCTGIVANAVLLEYLWVLTRDQLVVDSPEFN
jgi:hypothetical protein